MKAEEIAEAFRALFDADGAIVATCVNEQSAADLELPLLGFDCTTVALNGSGTALTFTLTLWAESKGTRDNPTDADPLIAHDALVEAARVKLLTIGKAALLVALNAPAVFSFRGWNAGTSDPAVGQGRFRTPLVITGTVLVL